MLDTRVLAIASVILLLAVSVAAVLGVGSAAEIQSGSKSGTAPQAPTLPPNPPRTEERAMRTWTAVDGRTVRAALVDGDASTVRLKTADGKIHAVPLARLSLPDRDYVQAAVAAQSPRPAKPAPPQTAAAKPTGTPPQANPDAAVSPSPATDPHGKDQSDDERSARVDLVLGMAADNLARFCELTGLGPNEAMTGIPAACDLFLVAVQDGLIPRGLRIKTDKDAYRKAFRTAVANITPEKLEKLKELLTKERHPADTKAAFAVLAGAAGRFVAPTNSINTRAFDAAVANLTADHVERVRGFFADEAKIELPFGDKVHACYVLLMTAGRFVDSDGSFDKELYNRTLLMITLAMAQQTKQQRNLDSLSTALLELLRPPLH